MCAWHASSRQHSWAHNRFASFCFSPWAAKVGSLAGTVLCRSPWICYRAGFRLKAHGSDRMVKEKPESVRTYDEDGYKRRAACLCFKDEREEEVRFVYFDFSWKFRALISLSVFPIYSRFTLSFYFLFLGGGGSGGINRYSMELLVWWQSLRNCSIGEVMKKSS